MRCVVELVHRGSTASVTAGDHLLAKICPLVLAFLVVLDESILGSGISLESAGAVRLLRSSSLTASGRPDRGLRRQMSTLLRFFFSQLGFDLLLATLLFNDPIVSPIILIPVTLHAALEQPSQVVVVGLLLEHDVATVLEIF